MEQKIQLINDHPAIVSLQFINCVKLLFEFLQKDSTVFGTPVKDFFYRIEFQKRGMFYL